MKQEKITLSQLEGFLFNTRNTPELFGKCDVWHSQYKRVVCDNNILIVRFKKYINADFISAQLSTVGRNRLKDIVDAATNVVAIYWKSLKKTENCLPPTSRTAPHRKRRSVPEQIPAYKNRAHARPAHGQEARDCSAKRHGGTTA